MARTQLLGMPRAHLAVLCLALALGLLACAIGSGSRASWTPVAPQEWQKERGPVVPHDSFPRDCSLCHAGSTWHEIRADFHFDHASETGMPLGGAHERAECLRCHNDRGPVQVFAQQGCAGCHEDVHRSKLGRDCAVCHQESDWRPRDAIWKHARTRFPLAGSHAATACWTCHPGAQQGDFDRASTDCIACHQDDLAQATSPDHQAQGWTDGCQRCHLPTTWSEAGFAHETFPLTGEHQDLRCSACHAGDVFQGTPTACFACHDDDYARADNPDHRAAGFGTNCEKCHTTSGWDDSTFAHSAWPLTGAHRQLGCNRCHAGGVFEGTPTTCFACHQDDYRGARDHVSGNFPTTCEQCHGTGDWDNGTFDHRGIKSGCVQCHMDDYQGANDPDHVANGFSTSCEQCHGTGNWGDGRFTHPQFPINSGPHSNLTCAQCHTVPGRFRAFSCTTCHAHNQREMNDKHDRVRGYSYDSNACYDCHPNGQKRR